MSTVGVIGSGIGGIAFAIRMQLLGHNVTVFEANERPGGKLGLLEMQGYRFDTGPSLFTMPHLVDELFELAGKNPRDYFNYERLPEICRYFWEDQTRLKTVEDPAETAQLMAEALQEDAATVYRYIKEAGEKYNIVSDLFLDDSLHKFSTWTSKKAMHGYANLHKLGLFQTMHQSHRTTFRNPKTVQLFDRYATYNGSDPYQTPATLSIIPHLEYNLGAYFPKGGMVEIPNALVRLAKELGVQFHFGEAVKRILCDGNKVNGIQTNEASYDFDIIASNADIRPTYNHLLPTELRPNKLLNQPKSSSGVIFYWGVKRSFDELGVHNIFFSEDYRAEFDAIFKKETLYKDPTVYVHISSKVAKADAPAGCENWFILVNAPANSGQDWDELVQRCRQQVIEKMNRILGIKLEDYLVAEDYLDPRRIESRTSSSGGALYGNSSNNKFAAFLRHPNYRSAVKNLYWIGGSVHPGGGIPLCLSSAKIATKLFQENA
ncbi:1-hydroxycarotenoid 3,4-desaturase CrtD [Aquirufa sp.]|uniref:1-hydroxycarotenoid 3,4-desaturase CrtD n=1 Tax=Aquirufa sp. TaxID=2676249 RepID=UPI0037BF2B65